MYYGYYIFLKLDNNVPNKKIVVLHAFFPLLLFTIFRQKRIYRYMYAALTHTAQSSSTFSISLPLSLSLKHRFNPVPTP